MKSYSLNAIDYLLKPILLSRFEKSVAKAAKIHQLLSIKKSEVKNITKEYVFIKADRRYYKVLFDRILYIEGLKDYVVIYTDHDKIITAMNLKTKSMSNFADKIIAYYHQLELTEELDSNLRVMNPYRDNVLVRDTVEEFYTHFFSDSKKRQLIVGINPGRLGAGVTWIPFTDTKRLEENCGIHIPDVKSHEPSSVFVYQLIKSYGGPQKFYQDFYINSDCPLGFLRKNEKENWVNCNYYDFESLFKTVKDFIVTNLKKQIDCGTDTTTCFVLGKKNAKYLKRINAKEKLFDKIVTFNHPRYIVQYKSKQSQSFAGAYAAALRKKTI